MTKAGRAFRGDSRRGEEATTSKLLSPSHSQPQPERGGELWVLAVICELQNKRQTCCTKQPEQGRCAKQRDERRRETCTRTTTNAMHETPPPPFTNLHPRLLLRSQSLPAPPQWKRHCLLLTSLERIQSRRIHCESDDGHRVVLEAPKLVEARRDSSRRRPGAGEAYLR